MAPCIFQATIGIDFLSKTMYLEDRTVSSILLIIHSKIVGVFVCQLPAHVGGVQRSLQNALCYVMLCYVILLIKFVKLV